MSVVAVTSLADGGVRLETWADIISGAMCTFFDCNVFTVSFDGRVEFSFYGKQS